MLRGKQVSVDDHRRRERAHFLRKRREKVMPVDVGLPGGVRRRTPGLRREEVAVLAGVSPTWYTYLEQARDISPSPEVLDNLASVLGLNTYERQYLHNLSREKTGEEPGLERLPEFQALLDDVTFSINPIPSYLCSYSGDLLSWNPAAAEWLTDFGSLPGNRRNILMWMMTDEAARERFVDWAAQARHLVARFRAEVVYCYESPRVTEIVRQLSEDSPLFRRWWEEHQVTGPQSAAYLMHRPGRGAVAVRTVELLYREASGSRAKLTVLTPAGDAPRLGAHRELSPGAGREHPAVPAPG
ncbi:helix-turn-helix transcriptional regulator [Streptomyces pini]|nr:helix-turn-helix transcriptional regulator [Streptomyces pini]